jgi:hypothetical protein
MLRRDAEEHRLAAALRRGRRATTRHRTRTRRLAALVLRRPNRPNRPNRLAGGLA